MSWQVIGHDWAVDFLHQSLVMGRIAHAYLISGPPQVGKTKLALGLAQALNCTQPDRPCGTCDSCVKIARHVHPDVQLIVGKGAGESIKIDQVRALQREAVLAPYEGRYRVLILRRADLASLEAANSLLKTLEEPPAHVVLALTAVQPEALPATVISRCQRIDLRPASLRLVQETLHQRGIESSKAHLLSRLSGGRLGWALSASKDDALLHKRDEELDQLVRLLAAGRVERLDFAKTSRDSSSVRERIELWTTWWRDLLLLNSAGADHVVNIDRLDELQSLAAQSDLAQVRTALRALGSAAAQLDANVNAQLLMEGLLLALPRWRSALTG